VSVSASLLSLSLTNIGRAPLHYSCLSFRGLDVEAFRVLLDATIEACVILERRRYRQDHGLLTTAAAATAGTTEFEDDDDKDITNNGDDDHDSYAHGGQYDTKQPHDPNTKHPQNPHEQPPHDPYNEPPQPQNDLEWDDVTDVAHQTANAFTMQDHSGQTPLSLLFRRYRERVRSVIHQLERNNRNGLSPPGAATTTTTTTTTTLTNGRITRTTEGGAATTTTTPMTSAIAASAVQEDLGELWQKARLMVCLMAEKRLEREREDELEASSLECVVETGIGGAIGIGGDVGDSSERRIMVRQASAAAAVAMEAAKWAKQQHQHQSEEEEDRAEEDDILTDGYYNTTMESTATNATSGNGGGGTTRKFRLVHASVGLTGYGCPPEMIRLAASVYPNQVREMDEDGNLPLHIAAVASSFLPTQPPTTTNNNNNNNTNDESTTPDTITANEDEILPTFSDEDSLLSTLSTPSTISGLSATTQPLHQQNPFDKVIRMLLRIYPNAVRIPHGTTGRLPLALAIEGRKRTMDDGIRALLESHPAALESMDIDPKLYPRILAVLSEPKETKKKPPQRWGGGGKRWRRKNALVERNIPTALFEVLKAKPGLVSMGGGFCTMLEGSE